jgi:hypothetical protein
MSSLDPIMCRIIPTIEPAIAMRGSKQLVAPLERINCTNSKMIEIKQTIKNAQTRNFCISIFSLNFFTIITSDLSSSKIPSISTRPISKVTMRAIVGGIIQCEKYFIQRSGTIIENPNSKQIKANKTTQLTMVLFSKVLSFH